MKKLKKGAKKLTLEGDNAIESSIENNKIENNKKNNNKKEEKKELTGADKKEEKIKEPFLKMSLV